MEILRFVMQFGIRWLQKQQVAVGVGVKSEDPTIFP